MPMIATVLATSIGKSGSISHLFSIGKPDFDFKAPNNLFGLVDIFNFSLTNLVFF